MKLAIFDDNRLGLVSPDDRSITDVTAALPWPHDGDPLSGWWRRLCRDFDELRPRIIAAGGTPRLIESAQLRAPVRRGPPSPR